MTHPIERFFQEVAADIHHQSADQELRRLSQAWLERAVSYRYAHHFTWLGRPIIQAPQDIMAMQEIIWSVQPDLIIETGIAHGGSLIFYASLLELLGGKRHVLGIDIDIRTHNRTALEQHPLIHRITMLEGSSVDERIAAQVRQLAMHKQSVLVCLDSCHTHDHVLRELELYTPLVTVGSYCVVFDTGVEDLPAQACHDRPWGKGNNPKTAVWEFLRRSDAFEIDHAITNKLLITSCPEGYLKRVKSW